MQCFRTDNKTSFHNNQTDETPSTSTIETPYNFQDEHDCPKHFNKNGEVSDFDDKFEDVEMK